MPELGRAALVVTLGPRALRLVAGAYAALARPPPARASRRRTRSIAAFGSTARRRGRPRSPRSLRNDFSLRVRRRAHEPRAADAYTISALLGRAGGLAAPLAAGPDRLRGAAVWLEPAPRARPRRLGRRRCSAAIARLLRVPARRRREPVRDAGGAGRRRGLNPSLQNPYMVAHPPLLYLGYVGLAVPFAFAMGALLSRRTDERWIVATRRWTLVAWTALGIGQLLGAHWAYVEVGWGGYYAWDPVENAALMPWLAATAFLHSVMIQEKRGMLKVWNVVLVVARVLPLALRDVPHALGRRQLDPLVHAELDRAVVPRASSCIVVVVSLGARSVSRLPLLRSTTRLESLVSREATFLYNNLLLVALCLTILWGVACPILSEAVRGESVVVGRPYYDFFLRIFGLPLLLLMGIGPLVAWRRASLRGLGAHVRLAGRRRARDRARAARARRRLVDPGAGRVHVLGVRARDDRARVRARDAARRALSRRARGRARSRRSSARNRRRYGGYVVHAAIVLLAIGVAGSSAYDTVARAAARAGRVARGRRLHADLPRARRARRGERDRDPRACSTSSAAASDARHARGGQERLHASSSRSRTRSAIRSDYLTGEDLFVIAEQVERRRHRLLPRLRQAARQPDLARRARLPARLADRALAGRARAAAARARATRGAGAPRAAVDASRSCSPRCSPSRCVVLVALPFLREPEPGRDVLDEPGEPSGARLELAEARDRALAALKELELDHRTGKVSDEDYRALVGPLRREAAEALRALEPRAGAGTCEGRAARVTTGHGADRVPEPYPPPDETIRRPA